MYNVRYAFHSDMSSPERIAPSSYPAAAQTDVWAAGIAMFIGMLDYTGLMKSADMKDDQCYFCHGRGSVSSGMCVYCNGTGEWNLAAQTYVKNHTCQCITLDRKFCPVCNKACHHDTSLSPLQKIDPGHGGMKSPVTVPGMT